MCCKVPEKNDVEILDYYYVSIPSNYSGLFPGSTADLSCQEGYEFIGGISTVTCSESCTWSNYDSYCQSKYMFQYALSSDL